MGSVLVYGPGRVTKPLLKALKAQGVRSYLICDQTTFEPNALTINKELFRLRPQDIPHIDTLYYFPSPERKTLSAYRKAYVHGLNHLMSIIPKSTKVIYGSSAEVYGDQNGAVVDEDSPLGSCPYALAIAEGEMQLSQFSHLILRIGQSYNSEHSLMKRLKERKICYSQRTQYINPIHLDDLIQAVVHLRHTVGVYNIVDRQPVSLNALLALLSSRSGIVVHTPRKWINCKKGVRQSCVKLMSSGFHFKTPSCMQVPHFSE